MNERKVVTVIVGEHTLHQLAQGKDVILSDVDEAVVMLIPADDFPYNKFPEETDQ